MPYKRRDSEIWWVAYTGPDGQRIRRSTGTKDRREAEGLEAKWKLEAHQVRQWGTEPPRNLEELMLEYLRAHTEKRSASRDKEIARNLRGHFGAADCTRLARADVRGYIEARKAAGRAASTITRELALLSAMLNWARSELEWRVPNPVQGRNLPAAPGRVRWLQVEEAEALIRAAEQGRAEHLPDFLRLALHTGMRKNEMLKLEWARVDFRAGLIHLAPEHTKTGRRRSVPINETARAALLSRARFRATHAPACPWVFCDKQGARIASVRTGFEVACRKAGIEDFRIHDLRHTCAAWLVSAGVLLAEVRDLLGHASITMTEKYAHLAPDNVRAAVSVLDGVSRFAHGPKKSG